MSEALLPLRGIRVLDLSRLAAGNMLTLQLADFGAEVIKVEPPGGDTLRGWKNDEKSIWWKIYARNKKSICLDLKQAEDVQRLLEMVPSADVLIESFRHGGMEGFGLSMEELHCRNPRLVIVRISGWGQTGPYARKPGFGTLIEAFSGFAQKNGFADKPPALPNLGLADMIAGLSGASATMFALREVEVNHGKGQVIDLSLLEPMLAVLGPDAAIYQQTACQPRRMGNRADGSAPRNAYTCSDGKWVVLSGSTQSMAEKILAAVGYPELNLDPRFATNAARLQNVEELDALIGGFIGQRTQEENLRHFAGLNVTAGPIYNIAELMDDPHIKARACLTEIEDDELGALPMHNVFPRLSGTPGSIRTLGPRLGEHQDLLPPAP
jgi:crotonobetainyl-CoA:carnitine CoA-transferase CaiB-like acyl-CoA transferase